MRRWLLLLFVPALVWAEGEKAKEKPKRVRPGDIEIADPGIPIEDSAVARQEIVLFKKGMSKADSNQRRIELIQRIGNYNHPQILTAASKYIKHKSHPVAVAAVIACARQGKVKDKAGSTLVKQLKKEKRPHVICAIFIGLGALGYENKAALNAAKKYHRRDTKETHKAAARYFGYIKYKPAFRWLAEHLDEPIPKNPDDPTNPPASWWKERWQQWDKNVKYTRWALEQLVPGETFDSTGEAKRWAESEGKEHGIEWR